MYHITIELLGMRNIEKPIISFMIMYFIFNCNQYNRDSNNGIT